MLKSQQTKPALPVAALLSNSHPLAARCSSESWHSTSGGNKLTARDLLCWSLRSVLHCNTFNELSSAVAADPIVANDAESLYACPTWACHHRSLCVTDSKAHNCDQAATNQNIVARAATLCHMKTNFHQIQPSHDYSAYCPSG